MDKATPPESIFKSYDIRGIYPNELNEKYAVPITRAIYKVIYDQLRSVTPLTIALGRDMRLSSPVIFEAVSKALVELGAKVVDLGIVSTTTFYFAVFKYGYDGGIQITASHNPKEYNGMKIVRKSPNGLIKIGRNTGMVEIKKNSLEGVGVPPSSEGALIQKIGVVKDEVENALKIVGNPHITKFKIVADAANAVGGLYIDELFKHIPGELIKMNFELDGAFPAHQADPLQKETLVDLQKKVIETGADLGLAPDGDGDRLFFIDEKGEIVQPSTITALVARELLKTHPKATILANINYIMTPKKIVEELGGRFGITKVGHAFITEQLERSGGIFAGESSAHYFFKETGNAESQLPVILTILKVMKEEGRSFSEISAEVRRSFESGEINFTVKNAPEILAAIKSKFIDGQLNELDGAAISYPEWRMSIRTSNTEPLLRLNVEAETKELVNQKKEEIIRIIEDNAIFEESQSH